jgi:hypothetical protein
MEVVGDPDRIPDVQSDFHKMAEENEERAISVRSLKRFRLLRSGCGRLRGHRHVRGPALRMLPAHQGRVLKNCPGRAPIDVV